MEGVPESSKSGPAATADLAEAACREGIPLRAVALRFRNRGVPSGRAADLAEEAAAESIARSLTRSFQDGDHYRAWVIRVALNCATDVLRRPSRCVGQLDSDPAAPDQHTPLRDLIDLAKYLQELDELPRHLIELSYLEGLTLDQIADRVMGIGGGSPNARRLRIKRRRDAALAELKAIAKAVRTLGFNPE